jgi:hypothetical protein
VKGKRNVISFFSLTLPRRSLSPSGGISSRGNHVLVGDGRTVTIVLC